MFSNMDISLKWKTVLFSCEYRIYSPLRCMNIKDKNGLDNIFVRKYQVFLKVSCGLIFTIINLQKTQNNLIVFCHVKRHEDT